VASRLRGDVLMAAMLRYYDERDMQCFLDEVHRVMMIEPPVFHDVETIDRSWKVAPEKDMCSLPEGMDPSDLSKWVWLPAPGWAYYEMAAVVGWRTALAAGLYREGDVLLAQAIACTPDSVCDEVDNDPT